MAFVVNCCFPYSHVALCAQPVPSRKDRYLSQQEGGANRENVRPSKWAGVSEERNGSHHRRQIPYTNSIRLVPWHLLSFCNELEASGFRLNLPRCQFNVQAAMSIYAHQLITTANLATSILSCNGQGRYLKTTLPVGHQSAITTPPLVMSEEKRRSGLCRPSGGERIYTPIISTNSTYRPNKERHAMQTKTHTVL